MPIGRRLLGPFEGPPTHRSLQVHPDGICIDVMTTLSFRAIKAKLMWRSTHTNAFRVVPAEPCSGVDSQWEQI